MQDIVFPNYFVDFYAILWCLYFLFEAIRNKQARFMVAWCLAQIMLFSISFLNGFLNKGYCLFSNCEPTKTLRHFFAINFDPNIVVLIRFISISLMFLVIMKMHNYIERDIRIKNY